MSKQQLSALVPPNKKAAIAKREQGAGFRQKNPIEEQLEAKEKPAQKKPKKSPKKHKQKTIAKPRKAKAKKKTPKKKKHKKPKSYAHIKPKSIQTIPSPIPTSQQMAKMNVKLLVDSNKIESIHAFQYIDELNAKHGLHLKIISPHVAHYLVTQTQKWREIGRCYTLNTAIAYEAPHIPLGSAIIHKPIQHDGRVILPTGKYVGTMDIALTVPDLTVEDIQKHGKDYVIIVDENRIVPVPDFPIESGSYMPHTATSVPHGQLIKVKRAGEKGTMSLSRDLGSYVGFLVAADPTREVATKVDSRFLIFASMHPFDAHSLVVEVPRGEMKAFKQIQKSL